MSMQNYFISIVSSLLVLIGPLFSQIILEGTVRTHGMAPESVPNALVELIDQADTTRVFSSTTDDLGHYSIQITETGIGDVPVQKPGAFHLCQNYPNPFNPSTVISWELPHPADIRIEVYNVLGQKIKTLVDGFQSNPFGRIVWDGTNDSGQGVSAGVYIYSLSAESIRFNKKMLLLDGHSGVANNSMSPRNTRNDIPGKLNKPMTNQYLFRVTGDSLETYQETLELYENITKDVSIYRTIKDIDDNVYRIIKIGNQLWMAENLKVTHYSNGDAIPNVTGKSEWTKLTTGAYCYYDNNSSYVAEYGALYNWYPLKDSRNIAPDSWHVPTDEEWQVLVNYLGGKEVAGGKMKEAGTTHWDNPNTGATNESGFTGRPGGYRSYGSGSFGYMGSSASFWSSTETRSGTAWSRGLRCYTARVVSSGSDFKWNGFSIRLVQD